MLYLLRLARTRPGGWLLKRVLPKLSMFIPTNLLYDSGSIFAFKHPHPSYPVHILLVPKKTAASLHNLAPGDAEIFVELTAAVKYLVDVLNLEKTGYRLIVNGGAYQDMPQLHFHLVSGGPISENHS